MDTTTGTRPSTSPSGTSSAGTQGDGPGLSVQEAATALGVSVNTIRRWIKDGRLPYEKLPTPVGYAYRVYPQRVTPAGTHRDVPPMGAPREVLALTPDMQRAEATAAYTAALLGPLVAELSAAREQIAGQAERIGRFSAELAQAHDTIRALEAPRKAPANAPESHAEALGPTGEPPEPDPEPTPSPVPAPIPPKPDGRSWWRRLWESVLSAPG
jgi:excisionase family DNA binding protein